jgi:hypothetical protein
MKADLRSLGRHAGGARPRGHQLFCFPLDMHADRKGGNFWDQCYDFLGMFANRIGARGDSKYSNFYTKK